MDARLSITGVVLIIVGLVTTSWVAAEGQGRTKQEDKAIKQVLRSMGKTSKPLRLPPSPNNTRNPITVAMDFGLSSLSGVNEDGGYVDLEGMLTLVWQDSRLAFDLDKAGKSGKGGKSGKSGKGGKKADKAGKAGSRITSLQVDPSTIWTPDIELYPPMAPGLETVTKHPAAVVSRSGDVFLANQVRLRAPCDVIGQLSRSQIVNCTIKMGSWTFNGQQLQLRENLPFNDKLKEFQPTGLWTVTDALAWTGEDSFACCPETYPYYRFSFTLRKRSGIHRRV